MEIVEGCFEEILVSLGDGGETEGVVEDSGWGWTQGKDTFHSDGDLTERFGVG